MKNKILTYSILTLFLISTNIIAQTDTDLECGFLRYSKLKYLGDGTSSITINDTIHLEIVDNGKYFIKSKLDWISNCEYNATVIDFDWPEFLFPVGEVMNVKVNKISSDTLFLDLIVRKKNYKGKYIIVR